MIQGDVQLLNASWYRPQRPRPTCTLRTLLTTIRPTCSKALLIRLVNLTTPSLRTLFHRLINKAIKHRYYSAGGYADSLIERNVLSAFSMR